jgi:hypothetical protein
MTTLYDPSLSAALLTICQKNSGNSHEGAKPYNLLNVKFGDFSTGYSLMCNSVHA